MTLLNTQATKSTTTLIGLFIAFVLLLGCMCSTKLINTMTFINLSSGITFFISRLLFWVMLLILYVYAEKIEKRNLLIWKEQRYGIVFYGLSALAILISILIGGVLINQIVILLKLNHHSVALNKLTNLSIASKLFAVVTAAVVEEFIFRGYLMPRLQHYFKKGYITIIIAALTFGVAHIAYGTISNVLVPIFVGLMFGYHYYRYKNIKVLIVCHALIDFYALILQH